MCIFNGERSKKEGESAALAGKRLAQTQKSNRSGKILAICKFINFIFFYLLYFKCLQPLDVGLMICQNLRK